MSLLATGTLEESCYHHRRRRRIGTAPVANRRVDPPATLAEAGSLKRTEEATASTASTQKAMGSVHVSTATSAYPLDQY